MESLIIFPKIENELSFMKLNESLKEDKVYNSKFSLEEYNKK